MEQLFVKYCSSVSNPGLPYLEDSLNVRTNERNTMEHQILTKTRSRLLYQGNTDAFFENDML